MEASLTANDALTELRNLVVGWDVLREEDGWLSATRLTALLGIDRSTTLKRMNLLHAQGLVTRRVGHSPGKGGKGFFYRILDPVLQKKFNALLTKISYSSISGAHGTNPERNRPRNRLRTSSGRRRAPIRRR